MTKKYKACGALIALAALVGACDTGENSVLEPDDGTVTAVIDPATSTTLSAAGGIELVIPAGAVAEPTEVRLRPISGLDGTVAGRVLDGTAFRVEPALSLLRPATLKMRFDAGSLSARDQIAATAVRRIDGRTVYHNGGSLDLSAGILRTTVDGLGDLGVRIAADSRIPLVGPFQGTQGGAAFRAVPNVAYSSGAAEKVFALTCGEASESGLSCVDAGGSSVDVAVSQDLLNAFGGDVAVIGPTVVGSLTFRDDQTVEGFIEYSGTLRFRAGESVTSKVIDDRAVTGGGTEPTPVAFVTSGDNLWFGGFGFRYTMTDEELVLVLPATEIRITAEDGSVTTGTAEIRAVLVRS